MRISFRLADLAEPLQLVSGSLDKKQTLPILSHLHCTVSERSLTIKGFDQELEVCVTCAVTILDASEHFEFTLPGRKFIDICRYFEPEDSLQLIVEQQEVTLQCGRFRSQLAGLAATDFPEVLFETYDVEIPVSIPGFRSLIEQVAFAMAANDVRYFFNGMLLESKDGRLSAVATNGQRLAQAEIEATSEKDFQAILPRKSVVELLKCLRTGDDGVLQINRHHLRLINGTKRLTSSLIDASYPDYRRAIPLGGENVLRVERDGLRSALARISILANELYHNVKMSVTTGQLQLDANNAQQEEAEESLIVDYDGESLEIAFNVGYLTDVLAVLSGDTVEIRMSGSVDPMLITSPDRQTARYVISPMVL